MDIKNIDFVNLHAHSGVGSPFDGFGYPQDHMDYAFSNGSKALALTDHGNMNGFAYQVLHAKKMKEAGKDFKPIFGVEAYFIEDVVEWKSMYEKAKVDKKRKKEVKDDSSGISIETEGESKSKGRSDINRSRHLILIAMSQKGLNNIFKMVSESHKGDYFYRKPRVDFGLLEKYGEDVIAASACLGGVYAGAYWSLHEEGDEAVLNEMRRLTTRFQSILGDRWYGELQWNRVPQQHELNRHIIQIHKETGLKLISTADSHYPTPEAWQDRELYKRLGWLGRSKPEWLDMSLPAEIQELECELYPKNAEQMWESYKRYSKECDASYDDQIVLNSIKETQTIAFERIETFLPDNTVRLPSFVVPAGYNEDDYLRRLTTEGMFNILQEQSRANKDTAKKYKARIDEELSVISDRGFSKYFLTMKAVADKASNMMLTGTGRGSAAGSLVAYALGITQVDPIKYGLLFSRFLRKDAKDYPDIDYDVAEPMELKDHLIEAWGDDCVAPISNWNTLQLKSLIKDISKMYDIEFREVNIVTGKMISEATPLAKKKHGLKAGMYIPTWEEVLEFSDTLKSFLKKYPEVERHVKSMVGQYRSCSRHAGGVVIAEDLDKYMPLIQSGGVIQTPWSEGQNVHHLEPMGFIKFDLLGLTTLRMIQGAIERILKKQGNPNPSFLEIKAFYNKNLHPSVLDFDNQRVYKNVFHKGKWAGIFQFTESGAQNFCKSVKPKSIVEISAITSIFRPGPLSAGVHEDYVRAKDAPDKVFYENEIVREITEETYGFLIFQEQIALLAHRLGDGISLDEGNMLRKLLTKKGTGGKGSELTHSIKDRFIRGCVRKGMRDEDAKSMWQNFAYFSGYGFNKSHAVCYSMISYQCAWLMTYHEGEWLAAYLDKVSDKKKESAVAVAKTLGYKISDLNVNISGKQWEYVSDSKSLLQPLTTIKGLGASAMEQVVNNRPFRTVEDFLFHSDVKYSKLNKKALDVLVRAGACNNLMDKRFNGTKHFWSSVVVDRPKNKKKFAENIELYKAEGDFSKSEIITFKSDLTGIFPFHLVMSDAIRIKLEQLPVVPISEYELAMSLEGEKDDELLVWFVPRKLIKKKTAKGKEYWILQVVDSNNAMVSIKCWNPTDKDTIFVNQPYMARLEHSEQWGFSTRSIQKRFRLLG